jgi:creatinine amidohydrolase
MTKANNERVFQLEKMSHSALKKLDREHTCVIATISPLEVHGPHLPLGQDIFEAYTLAQRTAAALAAQYADWNFVLVPPVPVAADALPQMGSVNFPARVVREVAYYTLRPFAQHGFARLAYSSFHGGPRHFLALEAAADALSREFNVAALSMFSAVLKQVEEGKIFFDPIEDSPERRINLDQVRLDQHAGFVETSFGLHLWPELVEPEWPDLPPCVSQPEKAERDANGSFMYQYAKRSDALDGLRRTKWIIEGVARAIKHFRRETYHGYPAFSSAEQGRLMWEHLIDVACGVCREFLEQGRAMDGHSPLWKFRHIFLSGTVNYVLDKQLKIYAE